MRKRTTSTNELIKRIEYPEQQADFPTLPPPAPPEPLPNVLVVRESSGGQVE